MKKNVALMILVILMLTSCAADQSNPSLEAETSEMTPLPSTAQEPLPVLDPIKLPDFKSGSIEAKLAPYSVNADLSNIENVELFFERLKDYDIDGLSTREKKMLEEQAFFVRSASHEQIFTVYDINDYAGVGNFITTDSVLHMYHIFYDYTLRTIESKYLYDRLTHLTSTLIQEQLSIYSSLTNEQVKRQSERVLAYLSVASLCLGTEPTDLPAGVLELARAEYARIGAQEGYSESLVVTPGKVDYSQFKVRGHYTVSDTLKRYFQAMMWYGQAPMDLYDSLDVEQYDNAVMSMLLQESLLRNPQAASDWMAIYDITSLFVGKSVDLTVFDHMVLVKEAFGSMPAFDSLYDDGRASAFYKALKKMPPPAIANLAKPLETQKNFRLMGQRFTLDIDAFEELVDLQYKPLPTGLDLFAVFGSESALTLRLQDPATIKLPQYSANMEKLKKRFDQIEGDLSKGNFYSAWLWTLSELGQVWPEGYPSFMQNESWARKELNTGLGSYTELKHDTILYGKPMMAQAGGDMPVPIEGPQFVEPHVRLYEKLYHLLDSAGRSLEAYGYADEAFKQKLKYFMDFDELLIDCSRKLLLNEVLSTQEKDQLRMAGAHMESIMVSFFDEEMGHWSNITNESDRNMALIADIANVYSAETGAMISLKEAIGPAYEIFVVVPENGKLYLTRGAVFSYFEFADDKRYTDEEWEALLKQGRQPAQPDWTRAFISQ